MRKDLGHSLTCFLYTRCPDFPNKLIPERSQIRQIEMAWSPGDPTGRHPQRERHISRCFGCVRTLTSTLHPGFVGFSPFPAPGPHPGPHMTVVTFLSAARGWDGLSDVLSLSQR